MTGSNEANRASADALWDEPAQWADVPNARVAYRKTGSGPALLFIHGWPLSSFSFRKLLPDLARRFTCYLPDSPGLGETEWSEATAFRFADQARTFRRLVERLELSRYSILAFDTGATIARELSLIDAARVERLVLLNTEIPHHRPPFIELFQKTMRLPGSTVVFRRLLRSRSYRRSTMGFGGCFVDLDLLDGAFHSHFIEPLIASPKRIEGVKRYLQGIDWQLVDSFAERHASITQPVTFIWGADDPTFPIVHARRMVDQLPNCRGMIEIPNARLLVHEERPAEVARAALDALLA